MARQVFFSFHYQRDVQRANVVRNSQTIRDTDEVVGYYDHSLWEEAQTSGAAAIKALIDAGLKGASVTAVLIGLKRTPGSGFCTRSWNRTTLGWAYSVLTSTTFRLGMARPKVQVRILLTWSPHQPSSAELSPFPQSIPYMTGSTRTATATQLLGLRRLLRQLAARHSMRIDLPRWQAMTITSPIASRIWK